MSNPALTRGSSFSPPRQPGTVRPSANLLFVANFPHETGYAWTTIEAVFRAAGRLWMADGYQAKIAFPDPAEGEEPDLPCIQLPEGLLSVLRLLRRHRVRVLYLTDRPTRSWRYLLYRIAGVRWIVVHDRASGEKPRRGGALGAFKFLLHRFPGLSADRCVAVSSFVSRRLREVNRVPTRRVVRIYNGVDVDRFAGGDPGLLRTLVGAAEGVPIVLCAGRAQQAKGVHILIEAAAILRDRGLTEVAFAYCGDGPDVGELQRLAAERQLRNFHFLGKRNDVAQLLGGATMAVVPSVWAEAFGLSVAESMAAGIPVIGTTVGGIPELIDPGVTGLLIPPGQPAPLADALAVLLRDPELRYRMGIEGRRVARQRFALERVAREMHDVLHDLVREQPGATIYDGFLSTRQASW